MLQLNLESPQFCNDTRLLVKVLKQKMVEAIVLTDEGDTAFSPPIPIISFDLPCLPLNSPSFHLVTFAMTSNKAQGPTQFASFNLQKSKFFSQAAVCGVF